MASSAGVKWEELKRVEVHCAAEATAERRRRRKRSREEEERRRGEGGQDARGIVLF